MASDNIKIRGHLIGNSLSYSTIEVVGMIMFAITSRGGCYTLEGSHHSPNARSMQIRSQLSQTKNLDTCLQLGKHVHQVKLNCLPIFFIELRRQPIYLVEFNFVPLA
jgi:hypothetical protein